MMRVINNKVGESSLAACIVLFAVLCSVLYVFLHSFARARENKKISVARAALRRQAESKT